MSRCASLLFLVLIHFPGEAGAETARHPDELSYTPVQFDMATAERDTLESGIPVLLFQNNSLPLLNISIVFRMGLRYLPVESFAASRLLGEVWRDGGTEKMSPDSLDERLARKNIQISTSSGNTFGRVSVSMVSEDLREGLQLWSDVLLHPAFEEDRLERARGRRIKALQSINNRPGSIADHRFSLLISGRDNPRNYLESKAEIEAVTPEALRELYSKFVHPKNALIGISGDFQPGQILPLLNEVLSGWDHDPQFELPVKNDWTPKPEPGVYILPGEYAQSQIRVGRKVFNLNRRSPDYAAARIQNYAVGYGRVYFRARQEGLSYGFALLLSVNDEDATLGTLGSSRPEVTVPLIDIALEEVGGAKTNPLSEKEIEPARNYFIGDLIRMNERPVAIVNQVLDDLINGRSQDSREQYFEALKGASLEEIRRCGEEYNHLDDSLVVLVVGDPSKLDTPLDSLGLGPVIELKPIQFGE